MERISQFIQQLDESLFKFIQMSQYFPKPYEPFGGDINIKVDLSNYTTKTDLKDPAGIDTSKLALKSYLANLKAKIDKIDVDKLKAVHIDLSKLSNAVTNDVVKKAVYEKLVTKVNNTDTRGLALKNKYDADKSDLEKKLPNITELVKKKTDYNAKLTEIESKTTSISGLATNSALTAVKNKILDVSNLVEKKTDYNTKISEIEKKGTDHDHDIYITTLEFNKLTAEKFAARLAQVNKDRFRY